MRRLPSRKERPIIASPQKWCQRITAGPDSPFATLDTASGNLLRPPLSRRRSGPRRGCLRAGGWAGILSRSRCESVKKFYWAEGLTRPRPTSLTCAPERDQRVAFRALKGSSGRRGEAGSVADADAHAVERAVDEHDRHGEEEAGKRVAYACAGVAREAHGQLDGQEAEERRELDDGVERHR